MPIDLNVLRPHWKCPKKLHRLAIEKIPRQRKRKPVRQYFKEILIIEPGSPGGKKAAFVEIQSRYQYGFEQMLIIGDRISNEIRAGNHLGCSTFWVQHGECAHDLPTGPEEEPTWRSQSVLDVQKILAQTRINSALKV